MNEIVGPITVTLTEKDRKVIMFALRADLETVNNTFEFGDDSFLGDDEHIMTAMQKIEQNEVK